MSRIILKNLPTSGVGEDEIKKHFADIDSVTDIKLKYNQFGAFRRFAFVGFRSEDAALRAIDKLNNTFIKNSKIALEICGSIKERKDEEKEGEKKERKERKERKDKTENSSEEVKNSSEEAKNLFENDPEFKEFCNLQRNFQTTNGKQIWADDTAEKVSVSNDTSEKVSVPKNDVEKVSVSKDVGSLLPRKKHKRSRGKKKPDKTKPKELFVYTAKVKGFPETTRRKDVKDFFKPLELLSVRLNKRDEVCYVSFKDESDLKFALRKDLHFCGTNRIRIWRHDVKKSRVFKEKIRDQVKVRDETVKKYEASLAETEPLEESGRLFVRNLNYTCTQEDLEQVFSKYGELSEVHFPIDKNTSLPKGYAYVEFMFPQNAIRAFEELNGTIFQGRNFHLIPSKPKPEPNPDQRAFFNPNQQCDQKSSFKRDKLQEQKETAARKTSSWNILFLGQNALADVVSDIRGVEKSKLLTQQSHKDPIAVRMALGDAQLVDEMRKFLVSNGIELDSFDNPQSPRSRTVIVAKNLPAGTEKSELTSLFEAHGRVSRVIIPPNGLTAIIEMEEAVDAKLAFKRLAYSKFKDSVLYLEWAPINVFRNKSLEDQERTDLKQLVELQTGTKILVKNIPFEATIQEFKKIFAAHGELNFVRIPKKIDGQHRGFGFVDYLTKEDALRAFRSLCHSTHLYGRKLVLEWAKSDDPSKQQQQY